jgi:hypothetical protein
MVVRIEEKRREEKRREATSSLKFLKRGFSENYTLPNLINVVFNNFFY